MIEGSVGEAARAMNGVVISGDPDTKWCGGSLDSRGLRGRELFFALPGEVTDGHCFVDSALKNDAAAAVIHQPTTFPVDAAVVEVDNTLDALHNLTRAIRLTTPQNLIAITGSIGKSTTKELLTAMLGRRFRVAASPGNLNNLYGFPLALMSIDQDTEWMVAEMGMSSPGELGEVSRLGRPDVALFGNVREVHLEFFGSLRAIADAKAELLLGLNPEGLIVANADDVEIRRFLRSRREQVIWYGIEQPAEYTATEIQALSNAECGYRMRLHHGSESSAMIDLPLYGRYNVSNCLAAATCAHTLGVSFEEIGRGIEAVRELPGRGVVHKLVGGATLIDDTYNSSPSALAAALESAAALSAPRCWVVLGDMLELGERARSLHYEAGRLATELGFSPFAGVGELAQESVQACIDRGLEAVWFATAADAAAAVPEWVQPGDVVLIKGSRGVGLEVVARAILKSGGQV